MNTTKKKIVQRHRRHKRVRAKVAGTAHRPRLSVFKSNRYLYAQLIDDEAQKTLMSVSALSEKGLRTKSMKEQAEAVGKRIAERAVQAGIKKAVFDRGGFLYSGIIKAAAEAARKEGLIL